MDAMNTRPPKITASVFLVPGYANAHFTFSFGMSAAANPGLG